MALNPSDAQTYNTGEVAPSYSTAGGYVPGQVESTGGGYDPNNPSYGNQANSLGGDAALSQNYTGAPSYAGGYYGDQVSDGGGGYDPNNPSYGDSANSIGGEPSIGDTYNGYPNYDPSGGYVPGQEESTGGGYDPAYDSPTDSTVSDLSDPSGSRLNGQLNAGGYPSGKSTDPTIAFQSMGSQAGAALDDDWRVRISLADRASILYKDGSNTLCHPLVETNGVIFPYTPQITITHAANYSSTSPTHTNYPMHFYKVLMKANI
jgi:hypothetical protein